MHTRAGSPARPARARIGRRLVPLGTAPAAAGARPAAAGAPFARAAVPVEAAIVVVLAPRADQEALPAALGPQPPEAGRCTLGLRAERGAVGIAGAELGRAGVPEQERTDDLEPSRR